MNLKFHKNCENTVKIQCQGCNFAKFDVHFLGLQKEIFFDVLTDNKLHL